MTRPIRESVAFLSRWLRSGRPRRRAQERRQISWPVHALGAKIRLAGAVALDVNEHGVFIASAHPRIEPGVRLSLLIFVNGIWQGAQAEGTVRWCGYHPARGVYGFGFEYDAPVGLRQAA